MTFLLAMSQRALKQEKIKNPDHDTIVLGDDQIVRTVRIRSTRNPFRTGISWFKREESVSYVAKTCKGGLRIKASLELFTRHEFFYLYKKVYEHNKNNIVHT